MASERELWMHEAEDLRKAITDLIQELRSLIYNNQTRKNLNEILDRYQEQVKNIG